MINIQKAAVIGCGFVGASIAYTLMQKGIFSELVLIDAVMEKAEGEAMDISHGLPFAHAMDIYAGTYADIADASILIITACFISNSYLEDCTKERKRGRQDWIWYRKMQVSCVQLSEISEKLLLTDYF